MQKYKQFREYSPENELPELISDSSDGLQRSGMVIASLKDSEFGPSMATYRSDGVWELYSPYLCTSGEFETKDIEYWLC